MRYEICSPKGCANIKADSQEEAGREYCYEYGVFGKVKVSIIELTPESQPKND